MVESAFEFADICRDHDYHNFLFSMKVGVCGGGVGAHVLHGPRWMGKRGGASAAWLLALGVPAARPCPLTSPSPSLAPPPGPRPQASNPLVMVQAYRLLAEEQYNRGWDYPLHLGVTEAGEPPVCVCLCGGGGGGGVCVCGGGQGRREMAAVQSPCLHSSSRCLPAFQPSHRPPDPPSLPLSLPPPLAQARARMGA